MPVRTTLSICIITLLVGTISGQITGENAINQDRAISSFIETIAEEKEEEEEQDYDELFDQMEALKENPVNINIAGEEELRQIYYLDDYRISCLLDYIENYGDIITLYELTAIEGFDNDLINAILPYIAIHTSYEDSRLRLRDLFKSGKNQVLFRYQRLLETQKAYTLGRDSIIKLNSNQY